LSPEQRADSASIFILGVDEYHPVLSVTATNDDGVLDSGAMVMYI